MRSPTQKPPDIPVAEFLEHVKDFEMTVLQDNGIDRHLLFRNPKTNNRWFSIKTWNNWLAVTGDMGDYSFQRIPDMFHFFRDPKKELRINPGYWGEKCTLKEDELQEFSGYLLRRTMVKMFREYWDIETAPGSEKHEEKWEAWEDIRWALENPADSNPVRIYDQWNDLGGVPGKIVGDMDWFSSCFTYKYRFLWICRAIVWGIDQYDTRAESLGKWGARFLNLAQTVSGWSKDPSTKVGAVIVRGNRTIASTGFNGFPAGEDDSPELYADRTYKYEHVVHAEINALSFLTAKDRKSKDLVLYSSFPVCPPCMKAIGEAGIHRVVQSRFNPEGRDPSWVQEWSTRLRESLDVAAEFGIQVESY